MLRAEGLYGRARGSSALFSRWVVPLASVIKTKARCRSCSRAREPPYVGEKLPELHRERAVYPAAHLAMELGLDSAGMRSDPDINPLAIERILPDHLMGIKGTVSRKACAIRSHMAASVWIGFDSTTSAK